ncbi:TetR/AcrR family transcriptional regulator [Streptomyces sp. NRRL F-5123]|uniref:TetR/AcrR family transcriptional regulator n=1 Tax=Streptomyces sp. NRRL F-5123 TaxID=1463856 RepID=UPI0004E1D623|nr:TetR/AcrR family transcriptional regulator [Streptomyces sp. NRRL F-5123]
MTIQTRRERERAERERLIVTTARELAEAEGWDAVTTRRLAAEIEYSQPVLYSHFKGKGAIMAAVAEQGFAELAATLRAARTGSPPEAAGRGVDSARRGEAGAAGTGEAGPDRTAGTPATAGAAALAAVASAYTDFAQQRPALYDAMFTHAVDLPFATPEAPAPLRDAFGELVRAVAPLTGGDDPALLTETFWAALHGLVTLTRSGRLPTADHAGRLSLLIARFAAAPD